jgi:hypothetical protein
MVPPTFLPALVTILGAAAVPLFAFGRAWTRRKGLKRNVAAKCAGCGREFDANAEGTPDAFLVEGQILCPRCATQLRRRTVGAGVVFVVLAGAMFVFGWGPLVDIFSRFGIIDGIAGMTMWGWALFLPPLVLLGGADWTLRRMKSENVVALEAIARARLLSAAPDSTRLPDV